MSASVKAIVSDIFHNDSEPEVDVLALQEENLTLRKELHRLRQNLLKLEQSADMDPLVPIYNRRAFMRELVKAQSLYDRFGIPSYMLYIDLDDFKIVNDRHGHVLGDKLLIELGQVLQSETRNCDLAARLGGDEFGIILFKVDLKQAIAKGKRLVKSIEAVRMEIPNGVISVGATFGVSLCEAGKSPEVILSNADSMMYANKGKSARSA